MAQRHALPLLLQKSMAMAWYQDWFSSAHYHQLYSEGAAEKDAFLNGLLQHLKPPEGSRLLDASCGRGRHTMQLAAGRYDVNGVDGSMENISYAQQFEKDNLHFSMHDLRLPFWVNYFDYSFHTATLGYYATRREHDDAFHTLAAGLKTGGCLVIDQPNMHYQEDRMVPHTIKEKEAASYEINCWQDDAYFYKRIIISSVGSVQEVMEKWMKLSFGDITDMLSFQKMQVTEVFGNYQLQPFHIRQTPRMIVVAKKMG